MKIKISKKQWEKIGRQAGWDKEAQDSILGRIPQVKIPINETSSPEYLNGLQSARQDIELLENIKGGWQLASVYRYILSNPAFDVESNTVAYHIAQEIMEEVAMKPQMKTENASSCGCSKRAQTLTEYSPPLFDLEKMKKLVDKDILLRSVLENGKVEDSLQEQEILRSMFNTYVLGDSVMEYAYNELV